VVSDLTSYLQRVRHPIAVRSSSLFEDTFRQPFAGVYRTHVLSNSGDLSTRLEELLNAIRSVYASTFFQEAKAYVESTSLRTEEMKMAVIIQRFAGAKRGDYYYPDVAGVARAINFYPSSDKREKAEEGICLAVLGLGSSVVEGGIYCRFSPGKNAPVLPEGKPLGNMKPSNFQQTFLAIDVRRACFNQQGQKHNQNVVELPVQKALEQGTLIACGSYFDPVTKSLVHMPYHHMQQEKGLISSSSSVSQQQTTQQPTNTDSQQEIPASSGSTRFLSPHQFQQEPPQKMQARRIDRSLLDVNVHGIKQSHLTELPQTVLPPPPSALSFSTESRSGGSPPGIPVVTMSNLLADPVINLKEIISTLLKLGSEGFACPVELEWALTLSETPDRPHRFSILQIRPMSNWRNDVHFGVDRLPSPDSTICACTKALGNGRVENVRDIVFVPRFEPQKSQEIVDEISIFNKILASEKRPYVLIAPGRFGTRDPKRGIPLSWQSINGVACLVETELEGLSFAPSEGTHFFQNITSFGIGYLNISSKDLGSVDYSWLLKLWETQQDQIKQFSQSQSSNGKSNGNHAATAPPHISYLKSFPATHHVKHVTFDKPLEIAIDGKTGCAVVMKPDQHLSMVLQMNAFLTLELNQTKAKL